MALSFSRHAERKRSAVASREPTGDSSEKLDLYTDPLRLILTITKAVAPGFTTGYNLHGDGLVSRGGYDKNLTYSTWTPPAIRRRSRIYDPSRYCPRSPSARAERCFLGRRVLAKSSPPIGESMGDRQLSARMLRPWARI